MVEVHPPCEALADQRVVVARLCARSATHPFQLFRFEEARSQAVELDVESDATPLDDLTLTAVHGRMVVGHSDSRARGEGSHQTDESLTAAGVMRTRQSMGALEIAKHPAIAVHKSAHARQSPSARRAPTPRHLRTLSGVTSLAGCGEP